VTGTIQIGVAGWDYADWAGVVYPRRADRGFDRLRYLAEFVDLIEINSSFYRPVAPGVAEAWVRRTADLPRFTFTAKSHRSWTHEVDPDGLATAVARTLEGLTPLRDAGRLGAVLVQFPQSFHFEPRAVEHLNRLVDEAAEWPLVVEVRHVSWEKEAAADWFREAGVGWCLVDQPQIARSTARPLPRVSSAIGYARLHGRNSADWFRPDAGRDARYDFLYSMDQLRSVAGQAQELARAAERVFVVQNNHFRGKALVNALQLKGLVEQRLPAAPEELVDTYPELAPQVQVRRTRLF
jgi:uncharacterized protein YecE (DUF72 family)